VCYVCVLECVCFPLSQEGLIEEAGAKISSLSTQRGPLFPLVQPSLRGSVPPSSTSPGLRFRLDPQLGYRGGLAKKRETLHLPVQQNDDVSI